MTPEELRLVIRQAAITYAADHQFELDEAPISAVMFNPIPHNFHPASWTAIEANADWYQRTQAPHQQLPGILQMQSSNSSDALLMNIFCHPSIGNWRGVSNLLGCPIESPQFGFKALVRKDGTNGDATEIDLSVGDCLIEAKLTEKDFTEKDIADVSQYSDLTSLFHVWNLPVRNGRYQNYQVIRNLLAAIQHRKRHILLCDERRPDLVRSYFETVSCLKDVEHRNRCRVIFWQEIARACGDDLKTYLEARYGI